MNADKTAITADNINENLMNEATLPIVQAQVNLKGIAVLAIELAIQANKPQHANTVVQWWQEGYNRLSRADKAIDAAKQSVRELERK